MKYCLFLLIFFGGCSLLPVRYVNTSEVITPVILHPPAPTPPNLIPPKFSILTRENYSSSFKETDAYFAVDAQGYEVLSTNIQELRRYILELQSRILFYQESLRTLENLHVSGENKGN